MEEENNLYSIFNKPLHKIPLKTTPFSELCPHPKTEKEPVIIHCKVQVIIL
jgi:hypothetical protein